MESISIRYCSHPDGHAPKDCPDRLRAENERLRAALNRAESELITPDATNMNCSQRRTCECEPELPLHRLDCPQFHGLKKSAARPVTRTGASPGLADVGLQSLTADTRAVLEMALRYIETGEDRPSVYRALRRVIGEVGNPVADVFGDGPDERTANVKLFWSAPDLLAENEKMRFALKLGHQNYETLLAENERLRAALSNLALEAEHFMENGLGRIHLRESIEHANFALSKTKG